MNSECPKCGASGIDDASVTLRSSDGTRYWMCPNCIDEHWTTLLKSTPVEWNWTPSKKTPCQGLLYVYAERPATRPLNDDLTRGMQALLDKSKDETGVYFKKTSEFKQCMLTKGWHECICGATSTNVDYLVASDVATNSLCVHYLQCHRDEVSAEDLALVRKLLGQESPKRPRSEEPEDLGEKKAKVDATTYLVSSTRLAQLFSKDENSGDLSSLSYLSAHMPPTCKLQFPELFLVVIQDNSYDFWIEYRHRENGHTFCRMESYDPGFYFVLALIRSIGSKQ